MLGVNSQRELISGKFAEEVRSAILRGMNGELTDAEKENIRKNREIRKRYRTVWK